MNCCCNCKLQGTMRIWCPTWISAHKGPQWYCDEHAKVFNPEFNEHSKGGQFFYGDEAQKAFESVEQFIPKDDLRFANAFGMVRNFVKDKSSFSGLFSETVVVDGKVWVVNNMLVVRLGNFDDVKELMPLVIKEMKN